MAKAKAQDLSADDLDLVSDIDDPDDVTWGDDLREALAAQMTGNAEDPEPEPVVDDDGAGANEIEAASEVDGEPAAEIATDGEAAETPELKAPEHWSAGDKEKFAALPDTHKQWFLDTRTQIEKGAQTKFDQAAEARKLHEEITGHLRPYADAMRAEGMTANDAIRRLFAADKMLRENPIQGLASLAQSYARGVAGTPQARELLQQLATTLGVAAGADPQKPADGQAEANDPLRADLDALKSQLAAFQRQQQEAQEQANNSAIATAEREISTFSGATSADGKLLHPHFDRVRGAMALAVQTASAAGERLSLDDAYNRAVWSDPELQKDLIAAEVAKVRSEQQALAKQQATTRKEHAAKADRAKTPRTASVSGEAPSDQPLKDDLRDTYRELANGAA